jgi:vitamin B12/bleomycin/antimicrobial peptide transport system ATP-binding/permease protein
VIISTIAQRFFIHFPTRGEEASAQPSGNSLIRLPLSRDGQGKTSARKSSAKPSSDAQSSESSYQVMQAASAFTIVQSAFGWLVDNYPRLADWNACARRIASLMVSIDALERAETGDDIGRITRGETKDDSMLSLSELTVTLGDGTAVVDHAEVVIEPGERLLVAGDSGSGKSILVRAISGLWPWGSGRIDIHPDRRLFMLPQRSYVPAGTLRRATAYPGAADDWTPDQIKEALGKVGVEHLKDKIEDEETPWDQTPSGRKTAPRFRASVPAQP